jgi:hypothetical protein
VRALLLALALAALLVLAAVPAAAAGVEGVDLAPLLPAGADGRPILSVGDAQGEVEVEVRNLSGEPRDVRVYAVAVQGTTIADVVLGDPGSADWLGLAARDLRLEAEAVETLRFTVRPRLVPADADGVALVLEVGSGTTVVRRAATTVVLDRREGATALPAGPVALAALALAGLVGAHLLRGRVSRGRPIAVGD